jgi:topoisomerase-4 subunit A
MIYLDGKSGKSMVKRFQVLGITREKEYDLTKGNKGSKVLYLSANPNGEAEIVTINLTSGAKARKKVFDFDFSEIEIKGRNAGGNILTKYPVRKITLKSEGNSTLGGLDIWYDSTVGRLNRDERGTLLGNFKADDLIISFTKNGEYQLTGFDLTNRYDPDSTLLVNKFDENEVISALYYHGGNKAFYVKRFQIETTTRDKKFNFISEERGSRLIAVTTKPGRKVLVKYDVRRKDAKKEDAFLVDELIEVKGWRAVGNKITSHKVKEISLINGVHIINKDNKSETAIEESKNELKEPRDQPIIPGKEEETPKKTKSNETGKKKNGPISPADQKTDAASAQESDEISGQTKPEDSEASKPGIKTVKVHLGAGKDAIRENNSDTEFLDPGSTVEFDFSDKKNGKDQLGLFNE